MRFKITNLRLQTHLPGSNELIQAISALQAGASSRGGRLSTAALNAQLMAFMENNQNQAVEDNIANAAISASRAAASSTSTSTSTTSASSSGTIIVNQLNKMQLLQLQLAGLLTPSTTVGGDAASAGSAALAQNLMQLAAPNVSMDGMPVAISNPSVPGQYQIINQPTAAGQLPNGLLPPGFPTHAQISAAMQQVLLGAGMRQISEEASKAALSQAQNNQQQGQVQVPGGLQVQGQLPIPGALQMPGPLQVVDPKNLPQTSASPLNNLQTWPACVNADGTVTLNPNLLQGQLQNLQIVLPTTSAAAAPPGMVQLAPTGSAQPVMLQMPQQAAMMMDNEDAKGDDGNKETNGNDSSSNNKSGKVMIHGTLQYIYIYQ